MLDEQLFTKPTLAPTRNGYGDALMELGKRNKRVAVLTADLSESTRVIEFAKKYPSRFIECGVAEQNMVGVAAGMALQGLVPFVSSYATFMPGRTWDQIRVSVCYSNANVKLIGAHAGVSVGPDGATHQALEDIAMLRPLPNLVMVVPCDDLQTRQLTLACAEHEGPTYLRMTREATPRILSEHATSVIGGSHVLRKGGDVTIVACGPILYEALMAAETLAKQDIRAEVINAYSIKPLDETTILRSINKTGCCVTVEEHQITGGLYGAISELTARTQPYPIEPIGMLTTFGESGQPAELAKKYHMLAPDIIKAVKRVLQRS